MPKVSIILPHYNHGNVIEEAINSITDQPFDDYEIILIDDTSNDGSIDIIKKLCSENGKIKLFENNTNLGTAKSLNLGVEEASGEYMVCRAADDLTMPVFFETAVSLLDKYPQAGMCTGEVAFFSETSTDAKIETLALSDKPEYFSPEVLVSEWKSDYNIPSCSSMFRREIFKKAGKYIPNLEWHSDWFANMIIAFRSGLVFCPEVFTKFRLSSNSFGNSKLMNKPIVDKIYTHLLTELKDNYRDTLPAFMKSGALDLFYPGIVDTYFSHEKLWSIEISNTLQKSISKWNKRNEGESDNYGITRNIRDVLSENENKLSQLFSGNKKINIVAYGAGLHTEKLLQVWNEFEFPAISTITTTDKSTSNSFISIPIIPIEELSNKDIDLVILSSQSFEEAMAEKTQEILPSANILSFWLDGLTRM